MVEYKVGDYVLIKRKADLKIVIPYYWHRENPDKVFAGVIKKDVGHGYNIKIFGEINHSTGSWFYAKEDVLKKIHSKAELTAYLI